MLKKISQFIIASILLVAGSAYAVTYSFEEITNNSPIDVASQLSVDVTEGGGGVLFTFYNNVGLQSSITDIYFDNSLGLIALPISISDSGAGVDFASPATPGSLPSGGTVGFVTTVGFTADSTSPTSFNGVSAASEWVRLGFGFAAGQSFASLIGAMNTGTFRVGLHVQALSDGQSESYVTPVPEPEIYAMIGVGLGLMGWAARRRKQQAA